MNSAKDFYKKEMFELIDSYVTHYSVDDLLELFQYLLKNKQHRNNQK